MSAFLKILLLEDNREDAEMVLRLLKKANPQYQFHLAMNKQAYLEALDQFQPEIILSDNNLPQFSASEALQIVQQRSLMIPFILVTGTVSDEFAANIIKSGADDYILKDRLTRLPVAIETALKQRRLEKERQEAVAKLIQSEEKYRTLFLKSPLPKWIYDLDTLRFLEVNEATIHNYGYSSEEFLTMTIEDIRSPEDMELSLNDLKTMPDVPDTAKSYRKHLKKNGDTIIVESTAHLIEYNGRRAAMMVVNDITERKKAEEAFRAMEQQALKQKVQEQKKVTRAIIQAQEKERNHIGRELHDNVNQILASTKMYLDIASSKNMELSELVSYPMKLIDSAIKEIRTLTHGQVAPLKNIDLKELIQLLLDALRDNSPIRPIFQYSVTNTVLDDELKLNIYRIVQEQLNNIVKHADARNIRVAIQSGSGVIDILVADDGQGFDSVKKRKGIGISNMINRIESFNGEVKIQSSPGNGCTTRIRIPLSE